MPLYKKMGGTGSIVLFAMENNPSSSCHFQIYLAD
jgi:hypothetical protein